MANEADLKLIEIGEFEQTYEVAGDGEEFIVVRKADGKTYKMSTADFKAFLGVDALMQMGGAITPTTTLPAEGDYFWPATEAGTYTNAGGVVVPENSLAIISRVDGVYSISASEIEPQDLTPLATKTELAYELNQRTLPESEIQITGSKQQFDKSLVITGKAIQGTTGAIVTNSSGSYAGMQKTNGFKSFYISGLDPYPPSGTRVWFYKADQTPVSGTSYVQLPPGVVQGRIDAPEGSEYYSFTVKSSAGTHNVDTIMIEPYVEGGTYPSPHEAFVAREVTLKNYLNKGSLQFPEGSITQPSIKGFDFTNVTLLRNSGEQRVVNINDVIKNLSVDTTGDNNGIKPNGEKRKYALTTVGFQGSNNYFTIWRETDAGTWVSGVNFSDPTIQGSTEEFQLNNNLFVNSQGQSIRVTATIDYGFLDGYRIQVPAGVTVGDHTLRNADQALYLYGGEINSGSIIVNPTLPLYVKAKLSSGVNNFPGVGNLSITVDEDSLANIYFNGTAWSYEILENEGGTTPDPVDEQYVPNLDPLLPVLTPNSFKTGTQRQRVQAACDLAERMGGAIVTLGVDTVTVPNTSTWVFDQSVLLGDMVTVFLDDSKVKMANGVFDTAFRNKGIILNPENPNGLAVELQENTGLKLIGSGKGKAFIEGADIPYTAPHPINGGSPIQWVGDYFGWRAFLVLFANVKNYEISGISFSKTKSYCISNEHGCDGFHIHHLNIDSTTKNGDGVDLRKGCKNGVMSHITGNTSDDLVALNAGIGDSNNYPIDNYIFPLQVGGRLSNPLGDSIENIVINDISGTSKTHLNIVLCSGGAQIHNVKITKVHETGQYGSQRAEAVVSVYTGYNGPAEIGDMTNIFVNDVVSKTAGLGVEIDLPLQDSVFNDIKQERAGGNALVVKPPYDTQLVNVVTTNLQNG